MTEQPTTSTATPDLGTERFTPDYTPANGVRIYRQRLRVGAGGTATVTFRGQIGDATSPQQVWIEQGTSGRLSLYATVAVDDSTATEIKVAVVPTGKRIPLDGHRLGSVKGRHVYLLSIDGSVDRAAYDAEQARLRAEREAEQAARLAAQAAFWGLDDEGEDEGA